MNRKAAEKGIYTLFFGVGLDFQSELIEDLTKVRGSSYFTLTSGEDFQKIIVDDFNYVVTPIAYNSILFFESEGYEIEEAFGTPYSDKKSGCLTKINTLTASPVNEKGIKGSQILCRLKKKETSKLDPSEEATITFRYEDIKGQKTQMQKKCDLSKLSPSCFYDNSGIRKAILLVKYVELMRATIRNAKTELKNFHGDGIARTFQSGISQSAKDDIKEFKKFFLSEMSVLGDKSLSTELDTLDRMVYGSI